MSRTLRSLVLAAVCAAFAAGCGGGGGTEEGSPSQRIVVTRDAGWSGPTCGPREIGRRLRGLSDALATVDANALHRYWGHPGGGIRFQGFTIAHVIDIRGDEDGVAAVQKLGGIQLRFRTVQLNNPGNGQFEGSFWTRQSLRKPLAGKFGFACSGPTMIIFGAAVVQGEVNCPRSDQAVPANAMIVCTRPPRFYG